MGQMFLAMRLLLLGLQISWRHRRELGLSMIECLLLAKKTFNLGWCYVAFVPKNHPRRAVRSIYAAFASAAYDVLTDWRGITNSNRDRLRRILNRFVSDELCNIAVNLYEREAACQLETHGLDRGVDALRFILGVFEVTETFDFDIKTAGYALQAIDDLLDYEDDVANGDVNFLKSSQRNEVLRNIHIWLESLPIETWSRRSLAFSIAASRALIKAESLRIIFDSNRDASDRPDCKVEKYQPLENCGSCEQNANVVDQECPEYAPSET